jgi:hypothetical protein
VIDIGVIDDLSGLAKAITHTIRVIASVILKLSRCNKSIGQGCRIYPLQALLKAWVECQPVRLLNVLAKTLFS